MSFQRYDAFITPRVLTPYEVDNWRRKDKSKRDCLLVYNLETGAEIPKEGAIIAVTNREHQYTYAKQVRDESIVLRDVTDTDRKAATAAREKRAKDAEAAAKKARAEKEDRVAKAKAAKADKAKKKAQAPAASSGSTNKAEG